MNFIQENVTWIKDLFTIVFTGVGTIVAILTYRRARATILQPIRTEVIKKQSELLSRLLQSLRENDQSFEKGLDYVNLVQMNTLMTLKDYGFLFKGHEEIFKKVTNDLAGWLPCGKTSIIDDLKVVGIFREQAEKNQEEDIGKKKFDKLKNGEVEVEKIYLTRKFSDFVGLVTDYRDDPFMPVSIQRILAELLNDISNNLTIVLKGELESFMLQFSKSYFETGQAADFDPIGLYNEFNHTRVHHRVTLSRLISVIRTYLRIDESW